VLQRDIAAELLTARLSHAATAAQRHPAYIRSVAAAERAMKNISRAQEPVRVATRLAASATHVTTTRAARLLRSSTPGSELGEI
jgi:hypothetical protein